MLSLYGTTTRTATLILIKLRTEAIGLDMVAESCKPAATNTNNKYFPGYSQAIFPNTTCKRLINCQSASPQFFTDQIRHSRNRYFTY